MLRLKVIACDVFRREVSYLSAKSVCCVDVTFLSQGLHETANELNEKLRKEIEIADAGFPYNQFGLRPAYDYIILAYGLCNNSLAGLESVKTPLVAPKAHDCVTLLLGSRSEYNRLFGENPGTYWYSRGWIEYSIQPGKERYDKTYEAYAEKFGEDNADYLMEMEQGWFLKYDRAMFIDWPILNDSDYYRRYTQECAEYLKWRYDEYVGDHGMMEKIINGIFDPNEVLVVPPGGKIAASHDEHVLKSEFTRKN